MPNLDQIKTIIVVMMENRSFDHLLGYLALPPYSRQNVEGLKPEMMNSFNGGDFPVFHLDDPSQKLPNDPPHEREDISIQMTGLQGAITAPPPYPMIGFVESYSFVSQIQPGDKPIVMGYYRAEDVPATHFFAQNFTICDHWFAPIPTGTQPNRLMAMSGYTLIDHNQELILPNQKLVYDWLEDHKVRWRVYHQGIPFMMLMTGWHLKVVTAKEFKGYDDFQDDWINESEGTAPQVIFIEPRYTDAPHIEPASDDHAPTAISAGQQFLMRVYSDLMTNPTRWAGTLMIVTYNENGGFYDHVSPVAIQTDPPQQKLYVPFASTGPRVPAYLVSPFVPSGGIHTGVLDHTSILKLLGRKFGANGSYSPEVDARPIVGDLTDALTLPQGRSDTPLPPVPCREGYVPNHRSDDPIPLAFQDVIQKAMAAEPAATRAKFAELFTHFKPPPRPPGL